MHPTTRWGQRVAEAVRRAVEARGGTIAAIESYAPTTTTFSAEVGLPVFSLKGPPSG